MRSTDRYNVNEKQSLHIVNEKHMFINIVNKKQMSRYCQWEAHVSIL